jgi:hypothetical protein
MGPGSGVSVDVTSGLACGEPLLLEVISAKQRSKLQALLMLMVTAARELKNCSGGYKQLGIQTNTFIVFKSKIVFACFIFKL